MKLREAALAIEPLTHGSRVLGHPDVECICAAHEDFRAALAATPSTPGLDVERLTAAMVAWWYMDRPLARQDEPVKEWMAADAKLIAAEYTSLISTEGEPDGR